MDCQNIIKNLRINKEKSIGEVVIVVEGEEEEFRLLKHIFINILDYNYIPIKRGKNIRDIYQSKTNKNSTVIIINTENSNVKSIVNNEEFKDKLYKILHDEYNKSLKNVPIYILWDRDRESNSKSLILKALDMFGDSRDNDYDMNGLLLLSFPCLESYEICNFDNKSWKLSFETSEQVKKYKKSKRHVLSKINENTLLVATENMNRVLKEFKINSYDPSSFKSVNM